MFPTAKTYLAEAARNAMNRNDSQRSYGPDERPSTIIIREDIQEQKEEEDCDKKDGENKNENTDTEKAEKDCTPEKDEKEGEVAKTTDGTSAGVENSAFSVAEGETGEVIQTTNECKVYVHKAPCDEENALKNHCTGGNCSENFQIAAECNKPVTNVVHESPVGSSSFLKESNCDNQVVNFIGYGSVMPCDPAWKKQRSVSCDNGVLYSSSNVLSVDYAVTKEKLQRSYGWIPNGDSGHFFPTSHENIQSDNNSRKRKVGVSAKVSDIRGILKSGSLSSVDKDTRVSFDSTLPERRKSSVERVLSPVTSEDSNERGGPQISFKNLSSQNVAYTNPLCTQHSVSDKARSRILEEALSAESDIEMSDSCELKTIIIRLGNEEARDSVLGAACPEETTSINWRPKLGRNHKILSYAAENYSFDNPTAITDTESGLRSRDSSVARKSEVPGQSNLSPFPQRQIVDPSKKYSGENELVILDILQNNFNQRYSPQNSTFHSSSTSSPSVQKTQCQHQHSKSPDTLSPASLRNITISPPENYRNPPTTNFSSKQTESPSLQCSLPTPNAKFRYSSKPDCNHRSAPHKLLNQHSRKTLDASASQGTQNQMGSDSSKSTLNSMKSKPLSHSDRPSPVTQFSEMTPDKTCDSIPDSSYPHLMAVQGCDRKDEAKSPDVRRVRIETDDDTDESTTPLEEFFRTQGVKFDATSTKSKKL